MKQRNEVGIEEKDVTMETVFGIGENQATVMFIFVTLFCHDLPIGIILFLFL